MTQAIAMKHLLEQKGHSVCAAAVGTSPRREIPAFFVERMGVEVRGFRSPNFAADPDNRGILIGKTIWQSFVQLPRYVRSFRILNETVRTHRPDLIINFYEPLFAVYQRLRRDRTPTVCVAHQCLTLHPEFPFAPGPKLDRFLLSALTRTIAAKCDLVLGLSFTPLAAMEVGKLHVVPPLLRDDVFSLDSTAGGYLLVYLMSDGYAADIIAWHERNPDVSLHCFWDRRDAPDLDRRDDTLCFHRISDVRFLSLMAGCRGLVTTAGFESVCEAMYFGKPVLMVPVKGHYEQMCNAIDGERSGAGIGAESFDLDRFLEYLPEYQPPTGFNDWVATAPDRIVSLLEQTLAQPKN